MLPQKAVGVRAILFIIMLLALRVGAADTDELPVPVLSAPEVRAQLARDPGTLLINTLSRIEFEQQRIPGSINIPAPEVATTPLLDPADASVKIFYCMGVKCAYSRHAVALALKRGLSNVFWFRGGIPEWRQFDYPVEVNPLFAAIRVKRLRCDAVRRLLQGGGVRVLDVRPVWVSGRQHFLPGTLHIQMTDLDRKLDKLPRDKPLLVSDVTMRQSVSAARYLLHKGFDVRGVVYGGLQHAPDKGCPARPSPALSLSGWGRKP